jgi:hypothetical protein
VSVLDGLWDEVAELATDTIRVLIPGNGVLDPTTGIETVPAPTEFWCGKGSAQEPDRRGNPGFAPVQDGVQGDLSDLEVFLPPNALPGKVGFTLEVNGEPYLPDGPADRGQGAYWLARCSRAR